MKRIAVLGANSFSGQDFVDLLLDEPGREVLGISRSPERPDFFLRYKGRADLSCYRYRRLDMNRDMPALLEALDSFRPEAIVNFAAQSEVGPSWEHPEHWFATNTVSLARLVNHLRRQAYLKRYVHISSPEVYGTCRGRVTEDAPLNPSTPYAASKAAADLLLKVYAREFSFPLLSVRATNVYGARQQLFKIIPRSVLFVKSGRKIQLHGGGAAVKSYIHIRDVSRGELAVLERGRTGQLYHLSPDSGVAVRDVVRKICERLGRSFEESTQIAPERPGQDAAYVIDSSLARRELGWAPEIGLGEGVSEVVRWVESHWSLLQGEPWDYRHKE
ncbi:MAG: GDP-mannose 4,6-dehydratase [Elusimicrobia bacterium]|nr:GDP-mannose 4,6-dehydratase [Elusimicrobiota bacterium]